MEKIWYIPHPTWQYIEDAVKIATENGVSIIDANITDDRTNEWADAPKLTKVGSEVAVKPKTEKTTKPKETTE